MSVCVNYELTIFVFEDYYVVQVNNQPKRKYPPRNQYIHLYFVHSHVRNHILIRRFLQEYQNCCAYIVIARSLSMHLSIQIHKMYWPNIDEG